MSNKYKIVVFTSSRADFGHLQPLVRKLKAEPQFSCGLLVTGEHLQESKPNSMKEVNSSSLPILAEVNCFVDHQTELGTCQSMAKSLECLAEAFDEIKPDLIVLLGDRFEAFAAAQAATFLRMPIAHICGGDTTEGAFDEAFRHSISKMSHLHFVSHAKARCRLMQMGEEPDRIILSGSPGVDAIHEMKMKAKDTLAAEAGIDWMPKNILFTFHPVTLEPDESGRQLEQVLLALDDLGEEVGLVMTAPNLDPESRNLMVLLEKFVQGHKNGKLFSSLGSENYLSVMSHVDAVVGNSSSGLYEAPSLKVPTVNIGDRQKGRLQAKSVFNCRPERQQVLNTILQAFEFKCKDLKNPYGDGKASDRIIEVLKKQDNFRGLLKKQFYETGLSS